MPTVFDDAGTQLDTVTGINGVSSGGTGADLSATGPGVLKQATLGAAVTVAALTADDIGSGSISTAKLADGAVTTIKIDDGAVTSAKLDDTLEVSGTITSLNSLDHIYNVKAYGAHGNGRTLSGTATMNSGSPTLDMNTNGFTADDVGKEVTVTGAGAAGATLRATIIGYTDQQVVTLDTNASTSTTTGVVDCFYDDTDAIQEAIDTAEDDRDAGRWFWGTVFFPNGAYYVTNLTIEQAAQLRGSGRDGSTIKRIKGTSGVLMKHGATAAASGNLHKVKIEDLNLHGNGEAGNILMLGDSTSSPVVTAGQETTLRRVRIEDCTGVGLTWDANVGYLENCWVTDCATNYKITGSQFHAWGLNSSQSTSTEISLAGTRHKIFGVHSESGVSGAITGVEFTAATDCQIWGISFSTAGTNVLSPIKFVNTSFNNSVYGISYLQVSGGGGFGNAITDEWAGYTTTLLLDEYSQNVGRAAILTIDDSDLDVTDYSIKQYGGVTTVQYEGTTSGARVLLPEVAKAQGRIVRVTNNGTLALLVRRGAAGDGNCVLGAAQISLAVGDTITLECDGVEWFLVAFENKLRITTGAVLFGSIGTSTGSGAITRIYTGTASWNPANLANGVSESANVTVTGAAVGDHVIVSHDKTTTAGLTITGVVTGANTVSVTITNRSGSDVNIVDGTVRATAIRVA